jgi:hypothetical protein
MQRRNCSSLIAGYFLSTSICHLGLRCLRSLNGLVGSTSGGDSGSASSPSSAEDRLGRLRFLVIIFPFI